MQFGSSLCAQSQLLTIVRQGVALLAAAGSLARPAFTGCASASAHFSLQARVLDTQCLAMILTSPTVVWGPEGCSPGVFYSQGNKDLPIKTRFSYSKHRFQPRHSPLLPSASCVLQLVIPIGNWLFPGFLPPLNHKAHEGTHAVSTPAHASSTVKCPNYLRLRTRAIGVERKERSISWSHSLTIRSSDEIWKMSKIYLLEGLSNGIPGE